MTNPTSKVCCRCNEAKPRSEFHRRAKAHDGLNPACQACLRADRVMRRNRTPEERAAQAQALANRATKPCGRCGEVKPRDQFRARKGVTDGLQPWCRECDRIYSAEHYSRNREKRYTQVMAWRQENADRWRAAQQARYLANPQRTRDQFERWKSENRDRWSEIQRKHGLLRRGAEVTSVDLEDIWTGKCAICGETLDRDLRWPNPLSKSVDHIIPVSKGGKHEQGNIAWTHLVCNIKKSDRLD